MIPEAWVELILEVKHVAQSPGIHVAVKSKEGLHRATRGFGYFLDTKRLREPEGSRNDFL